MQLPLYGLLIRFNGWQVIKGQIKNLTTVVNRIQKKNMKKIINFKEKKLFPNIIVFTIGKID